MYSTSSPRDAERLNEFIEEACSLSISARFGLAMCFVNEFTHRFSISGPTMEEYRAHLWDCPPLGKSRLALDKWIARDVALLARDDVDQMGNLRGLADHDIVVKQRFGKIIELTSDLLTMSFYGAGEDEGTLVTLQTIYERSRPKSLPSVTPFKFSKYETCDGWGGDVSGADYDYWEAYSQSWWEGEKP